VITDLQMAGGDELPKYRRRQPNRQDLALDWSCVGCAPNGHRRSCARPYRQQFLCCTQWLL